MMNWFNTFVKSFDSLPISWVDFVTLVVLCVGFVRGRKRGLSEELLDTLQWLSIIVAGAFFYHMLADLMNKNRMLSLASYCVLSYIIIALLLKLLFTFFKQRFGQKLVESDLFGRFEFYAGMAAGALRFACIYFFFISMLHAPSYSPEEIAKHQKDVDYNYGSDFFPSIYKIQGSVFKESLTGKSADKYLARFLLAPSSTDNVALRGDNSMARRRERDIDAVMGGK